MESKKLRIQKRRNIIGQNDGIDYSKYVSVALRALREQPSDNCATGRLTILHLSGGSLPRTEASSERLPPG